MPHSCATRSCNCRSGERHRTLEDHGSAGAKRKLGSHTGTLIFVRIRQTRPGSHAEEVTKRAMPAMPRLAAGVRMRHRVFLSGLARALAILVLSLVVVSCGSTAGPPEPTE